MASSSPQPPRRGAQGLGVPLGSLRAEGGKWRASSRPHGCSWRSAGGCVVGAAEAEGPLCARSPCGISAAGLSCRAVGLLGASSLGARPESSESTPLSLGPSRACPCATPTLSTRERRPPTPDRPDLPPAARASVESPGAGEHRASRVLPRGAPPGTRGRARAAASIWAHHRWGFELGQELLGGPALGGTSSLSVIKAEAQCVPHPTVTSLHVAAPIPAVVTQACAWCRPPHRRAPSVPHRSDVGGWTLSGPLFSWEKRARCVPGRTMKGPVGTVPDSGPHQCPVKTSGKRMPSRNPDVWGRRAVTPVCLQ